MRLQLWAILSSSMLALGCGGESKCAEGDCANPGQAGSGGSHTGEGGTTGQGGSGGTAGGGGSGQGGSGGTGGAVEPPDTSWTEVEVDECEEFWANKATEVDLFKPGLIADLGPSPRLEVGFKQEGTITAYGEGLRSITIETEGGQTIEVRSSMNILSGVLGAEVTLEQTRDWTVIRAIEGHNVWAIHYQQGPVPAADGIETVPYGGPDVRYTMQCGIEDGAECKVDGVSVEVTRGDQTKTALSGSSAGVGGEGPEEGNMWVVRGRSLLRSGGCQDGGAPFASILIIEGLWLKDDP